MPSLQQDHGTPVLSGQEDAIEEEYEPTSAGEDAEVEAPDRGGAARPDADEKEDDDGQTEAKRTRLAMLETDSELHPLPQDGGAVTNESRRDDSRKCR